MKREFKVTIMTGVFSLMLSSGLFAQFGVVPKSGDFDSGTDINGTTIKMTQGKTYPFYIMPSTLFHPGYNPVTGAGIDNTFTWAWDLTSAVGFSLTDATANDNYVEISAPAAIGTGFSIHVTETPPVAWGSCTDAGKTFNVDVVARPSLAVNNTGNIEGCAGSAAITAIATVTMTPSGSANFRVAYTVEIATLDAAGTPINYYNAAKAGASAVQFYAVNFTQAAPSTIAGATNVMVAGGHTIITETGTPKRTRYTYNFTYINDLPSRHGDFVNIASPSTATPNQFVYYDVTGAIGIATRNLEIIVNPAPVTGPIYHIPATWAN